ncbi:extracellular solute-binding protein, partial [Streptomyces sp. SID685]|uniref:ABC transporter substrate-binding protein n=1 Tax=Streptomyces sp. SID685 TaxID=2690322 RepID=UPI00136C3624
MRTWQRHHRTTALLIGTAVLMTSGLSACGSDSDGSAPQSVSSADIRKALDKPAQLTVWSWSASLPDVAKAFEKKYPKIKIDVKNVGTGPDQYAKLQNAVKAGSGAPDLATVEYSAIPQFALGGSLVDLRQYGFDSLKSTFTPATWDAVHLGAGLYELPLNAGPMALFYNKRIFDKYHIAVPATWDEYLKAGRALHRADPKTYIAADDGNAGLTESLISAAGGTPFRVKGDKVTIDLKDAGTKKYAASYQKLIDEKLLAPITGWTTEWN